MKKRKILMTASVWSHIQNFHLPYLREFKRLGWETHVGCAGIPADAPNVDLAIELPFEKRMLSTANFHARRILRQRINTENYDLIITHTTLAAFFTRLAVKGMVSRPRLVNVMHGYLFDDDTPALKRSILLDAERLTAPETDLLLTMNQWDYDFAVGRRLARRVEKIPGMGVDFTKLDNVTDSKETLRDRLGLPRAAFLLLYAAEFSNRKSQSVLIEAMTALPERALLLLAGDGGQLDACKVQARELGLGDRVRFLGHVSDIAPLYGASDACVSASRSEGLPFNVMEAMHTGLPVVASRVKGHTDLIEDGVSGLLYEYGNARDCAEKLRQLMDAPALCQALSAAARARAGAYRLETVLPVVMDRYLSALDGSGRRAGFTDLREAAQTNERAGRKQMSKDEPKKPLISILMAVYEPRMDWLKEQLLSLDAQTYPNLRLYIRDDCSPTVPFGEIRSCVEGCIHAFPFELRRNEANLGSNGTFERLTQEAEGDYFAYCDQDDIWLPEKLAVLQAAIESENALLVCSDMFIIDASGRQTAGSITQIRRHHVFKSGEGLAPRLLVTNFVTGCTMLVQADAARKAAPFCPYMVHDHYLALWCAAEGKIVSLPDRLIRYRIHEGNQTPIMSGVRDKGSYLQVRILQLEHRLRWLEKRFRGCDGLEREIEGALEWVTAREANFRGRFSAKRKVWRLRRYSPFVSFFEIVLSGAPEGVFMCVIGLNKINAI